MADTSRPQFTITLGRSGQVVKRAGAVVDSYFPGPVPAAGIKRSVRDRLGGNVDAVHPDNKRQRGANGRSSSTAINGVDDTHLSKHDLRFKIMKKNEKTSKKKNVDLRDMLSRKASSSSTNLKTHQSLPEPRNGRHRAPAPHLTPEPKDDQWNSLEVGSRDDRRHSRDPIEVRSRDDKRFIWDPLEVEPRNDRRLIQSPVEVGPRDDRPPMRVPLYDDRQPSLVSTDGGMPSRLASTRTSRTLSQMDLSNTSFSLLDPISRPSQHRALDSSASLPPPHMADPLRRPLNDSRQVTYATPFPIKPAISDGPTKSVGLSVAPQLPMGGILQSQYPVEYHTVEGFLHSLGLDKYLISFKVEEVDMATLSQMGNQDLKEMNIPMGPRKKILLALLARNRRQAQGAQQSLKMATL